MNNQDIYIKVSSNQEKREVITLLSKRGAIRRANAYILRGGVVRVFRGYIFVFDLPFLPNAREITKSEIKNYNWNKNGKA